MINKISDNTIRETPMEETTQPQEPQAQSNMAPEVEQLVQATPEYKSGLIAEQRTGGPSARIAFGQPAQFPNFLTGFEQSVRSE